MNPDESKPAVEATGPKPEAVAPKPDAKAGPLRRSPKPTNLCLNRLPRLRLKPKPNPKPKLNLKPNL